MLFAAGIRGILKNENKDTSQAALHVLNRTTWTIRWKV